MYIETYLTAGNSGVTLISFLTNELWPHSRIGSWIQLKFYRWFDKRWIIKTGGKKMIARCLHVYARTRLCMAKCERGYVGSRTVARPWSTGLAWRHQRCTNTTTPWCVPYSCVRCMCFPFSGRCMGRSCARLPRARILRYGWLGGSLLYCSNNWIIFFNSLYRLELVSLVFRLTRLLM